jgi:protein-S-isoprenylcysteine O-methyltransferase
MLRVSLTCALLGMVFGGSLVVSIVLARHTGLALYTAALCAFHFLEFYLTCRFHPTTTTYQAFLLDHSTAYTLSMSAAILEYAIIELTFPRLHWLPPLRWIGVCMVLAGQLTRTKAMLDAGSAFTHEVADEHISSHILVRTGIFQFMRHPSYSGFYLWSLGTQIMLGNLICLFGYVFVLHRFFSERIQLEEYHLVKFFPEYTQYQRKCWSGIPCIA